MKTKIKLCITSSSGGHWTEAEKAASLLDCDCYYVTYATPHLSKEREEKRIYFVVHNRRNPILFIINAFQSLWILKKEKPDVILSTGADVTVPTCIIGKLLGAKLVFVEGAGNVYSPSLTGRLIYPIADLFLIQWVTLRKFFPKSVIGGPLL